MAGCSDAETDVSLHVQFAGEGGELVQVNVFELDENGRPGFFYSVECTESCFVDVAKDSFVQLVAIAQADANFIGWDRHIELRGCASLDPCEFTMSSSRDIAVEFSRDLAVIRLFGPPNVFYPIEYETLDEVGECSLPLECIVVAPIGEPLTLRFTGDSADPYVRWTREALCDGYVCMDVFAEGPNATFVVETNEYVGVFREAEQ